jgi:subtilisin family serine protease
MGPNLDIVAYGEAIPTTDRMGQDTGRFMIPESAYSIPCDDEVDYNCVFGGTSAASAQVSGVASLVLQRRPDLKGEIDSLKWILRHSALNPYYPSYEDTSRIDDSVGWGRVSAARALLAVARGDANNDGTISVPDIVYLNDYTIRMVLRHNRPWARATRIATAVLTCQISLI